MAFLAVEAAILLWLHRVLSPLPFVLAGGVAGIAYLTVWGMKVAIPIKRLRAEAAD